MENIVAVEDSANTGKDRDIAKDVEQMEKGQFNIEVDERDAWGNKVEFVLATVGFVVGLTNVWRFPYLCQKNGGGAFLIPYFLSVIFLGTPLFFLELAIGQRLRKGCIGVWNELSPKLVGVGLTSFMVSFYAAIYYNMIVGWSFYYLFISFQKTLPYQDCPTEKNVTSLECDHAGKTSYYWYRVVLGTTKSISVSGGLQWHLCGVLLLSWIVVFVCTIKGVQSTGKVVYFTATFPCLVLVIFFFRGVTLEGAENGLKRMFTPEFDKLANIQVWFEAATQVFYSFGVASGSLIAMSSYSPVNNNCKRDAILVSVVNCGASIFSSIIVFSILGFEATSNYKECWSGVKNNFSNSSQCKTLENYLSDVVQGPGLTFIAFTEAITRMPVPQLWAVLLFCMLLTLGIGTMFGYFAAITTPLLDLKILSIRKEFLTGVTCIFLCAIGMLFCQRSGEYWVQMFDSYSFTFGLLFCGFTELVIVNYIYGTNKFLDDIEFMIGKRPGWYWILTWKFTGPILLFVLLIASFVDMARTSVTYTAWDGSTGKTVENTPYPQWGVIVIVVLIISSVIWIPLMALFRHFGLKIHQEKKIGTTQIGVKHSA